MKMCTQGAAIKHLKANDPSTPVTAWSMRKMVQAGQIPSVREGHKILIDLDTLSLYLPLAKEPKSKSGTRLDKTARDEAFEEYQPILHGCVKRNLSLLLALRLEIEDVMQDLSIRMLQALDRYDETRCPSLPAFLYHELQYEILDMRRRNKPHGIVGAPKDKQPEIVSLDQEQENGTPYELPTDGGYGATEIYDILDLLSSDERVVVIRRITGEAIRKEAEKERLVQARGKLADYLDYGELKYA